MAVELWPIEFPSSVDAPKFVDFGREVRGVNPGKLSGDDFQSIVDALNKYDLLVFRNCTLTPQEQLTLTQAFDAEARVYGHGNNHEKADQTKKSIVSAILKSLPEVPQVQLIGNGRLKEHEGLNDVNLNHPHHRTFHKTCVTKDDEDMGHTRFYRWHFDAALYGLSPPKVTTLYALKVPQGPSQICRYDDGTGDELSVPLCATAFTSGANTFDILPPEYKSLAVRTNVRYAPHPFVWISKARALPTGLGIQSEGFEAPLSDLPSWDEEKVKVLPMVWKHPVTGRLYLQIHGCAVASLLVAPLPAGKTREGALFPDGAVLTDLKQVRELVYSIQRPGIAPNMIYPHEWKEKDLVLWNNRALFHSVVGVLKPDQVRVMHQCNLAASGDPFGPSEDDILRWCR